MIFLLFLILLAGCGESPNEPLSAPDVQTTPTQDPTIMVALIFGQSNAANFDEAPHTSGPNVFMVKGGQLLPAADPISEANGARGSVWPLLGDQLIQSGAYSKVIFYNVAEGGTALSFWSKDAPGNGLIVNAVKTLRGMGLEPTHILMHQGETDAVNQTDPATYQSELLYIRNQMGVMNVQAPFFISHATVCQATPYQPIRDAQSAFIEGNLNTFAGPDTDQITLSERFDGCHFGEEGQQIAANLWLNALLNPSKIYQSL